MKTLLILTLIIISMICSGQNQKGFILKPYPGYEKVDSWGFMDGEIGYSINGCFYELRKHFVKKVDMPMEISMDTTGRHYTGFKYDNLVKLAESKNGKFIINLNQFKVTDTIWISNGKDKVGVPAFEMLKYFESKYSSLTTPIWHNGMYPSNSILLNKETK